MTAPILLPSVPEFLGREPMDFPRADRILRAGAARPTRTPLTSAGTAP